MAEVYTVVIDKVTPVEITGGRVGQFTVLRENGVFVGASNIDSSGANAVQPFASVDNFAFYVTSPDELYAVMDANAGGSTLTLKLLHNR